MTRPSLAQQLVLQLLVEGHPIVERTDGVFMHCRRVLKKSTIYTMKHEGWIDDHLRITDSGRMLDNAPPPSVRYRDVLEQRIAGLECMLERVLYHIPDHILDPHEDNDPDLIAYVKKARDYLKGRGAL